MHRQNFLRGLGIVSLSMAMLGSRAAWGAPIFAITQDANGAVGSNTDQFTVGYEFQVGSQSLTVTSLGMWDGDATDGLAASHEVGIWTTTGTLLGSVTVPAGTGSSKIGDYRYVDLGVSVTLTAATNYIIGAQLDGDIYHNSLIDDFGSTTDQNDPDWPVFSAPDVTYVTRWEIAGA